MKTKFAVCLCLFTFTFLLSSTVPAQSLTVRQIMAEPPMAGMRPDGEKLSPDGKSVVFLWNAEGKLPRDLYLSSTERRDARVILRVSDLPKPAASPTPDNKLGYGLTVRDEFVKARENQLGSFEWSPDSKKLLFSQSGDLYVLTLDTASDEAGAAQWKLLESSIERRADLTPVLVDALKARGIAEANIFGQVADARSRLLNALLEKPAGANGGKSEAQKQNLLSADLASAAALEKLVRLGDRPEMRATDTFQKLIDELRGVEASIRVARTSYEEAGKRLKRYTKTQSPEFGARFLDSDRILFQQSGNLFVLNTVDASLIQLTREANPQAFISVSGGVANKAGTLVAYTVSDSSKQRALFVPNYLDEFTAAPSVRRGWSEQKLFVVPTDGSRDAPFEIKLPKSEGTSSFRRMVWAADGSSLIVDRNDKDTKRRQLYYVNNVGGKGEQIILVTDETDGKWQAPLSSIFEPNPKNAAELFFASERDGFNHLYLAKLEPQKPEPNPAGEIRGEGDPGYSANVAIKQVTKGTWQVEWAKWSAGGDQIVYSSTEENAAERQFYSLFPATGDKAMVSSFDKGMRVGPQIDDTNAQPTLLYSFSQWNRPDDLYAVRVCSRCAGLRAPVQITRSVPEAFGKMSWNAPKFLDFPTKDGKRVPAKVYFPAGFDQKKKYPMVIFVHGAGYLQNIINGWNNYYREFMFNEMLTQKGYVVLDIDYRGSAGYGRDWRTDVFDFLGGKDYDDHIDGIDFMVKNYAVDQKRIGVYGGSYGGFMAGMLATRAPERIAAAAALRPVFDWKNYYASSPVYTAQRLGFPDKNPEAYKRSSPISYADKLERPLLILHGMADDNVHVQDSHQMIEKLIRLGKTPYFEAMLYPSENHGFVRPESWADEYERILAFFEKHLK